MPLPDETRARLEEQRLTDEQVRALSGYGRERRLAEGELLFDERGVVDSFFVIVGGEVAISRMDGAEETPLLTHGPNEFTGGLAVLTGKTSVHRARAVSDARVIELSSEAFRRVAAELPEIADVFIGGLARRMRTTQRAYRQHEKLAALGRLSAGLAHELNNPAAAASRAAGELGTAVLGAQRSALRHDGRFSEEGRAALDALHRDLLGRPEAPHDPIALGDAEDALALWLEERGVPDAWDLAPPLAAAGVEEGDLERLSAVFREDALAGAVRWLAATLELAGLVREVSTSAGRISELVGAVKGYTLMDRSAPSEVDVVGGLEDTVAVMGHKLRGVALKRDYEEGLPPVPGHGGELNQAWTNLLDNAADAAGDNGTVELRAYRDGDVVVVEVRDDGPGIPPEVENRIFEPFFTTKPVGSGAGLGLDLVRRTVAAHGGEVGVRTGSWGTRFVVRLPLEDRTRNGG